MRAKLAKEYRWIVKVHPDTGNYPLGNRATVCDPDGLPVWYAVDHEQAMNVARVRATTQFLEEEPG